MRSARAGLTLLAAVSFTSPVHAAVQLQPVVTTGLASPTFVTNAHDGTNRLFIVEQGGTIKVVQPGSSTGTLFLDIHTKVVSGGERGLLGLAFHPSFPGDNRFYVYYTGASDGAIVIAEYQVPAATPNSADPLSERVLLTIAHPTNTNHNGGMLVFGVDGYLYTGTGDGGSANDPPNNSQNKDVLLGKILRFGVDPAGGKPYTIPPDNPFVGGAGADEIFAYGFRNPWRFSFDRATHDMWVGDVGQGTREEVDTPVAKGGNYGWRIFEGFACTNNDPSLCADTNPYLFPVFDYGHVSGRCSITGGYVYRGTAGALPLGTYVFADYCTGEIWANDPTNLLLDTTLNVSSFGEDEAGEIYVVGLGGTVHRLVNGSCTFGIAPTGQSFGSAGGTGTVNVTTQAGCPWTAVSNAAWVHVTSGGSGSGNGSVGYSVDANASPSPRSGTVTIAGQTFTVDQAGAPVCTYQITPTSAKFGPAGGTGQVTVTAPAGCGWTATSNASWVTVTGGTPGSGNGVVSYSVGTASKRAKKRNGTVTIAAQTFTVQQTTR